MDSSKAIANGLANPDVDVWDFSLGKAAPARTLPKGAILTLAAAGSEMSSSCVITNAATGEKRGYNSSYMLYDDDGYTREYDLEKNCALLFK